MTAIAGWAGAEYPGIDVRALLDAQRVYATNPPVIRSLSQATFGKALFPTLPEDGIDRGPMVAGRRFLLVADIRIDNRTDLSERLGLGLERTRSRSDSDLLAEAWVQWDEDCLDHLVGDFAFAVWDIDRRQLKMARDPTGQRPLFFASTPAGIAFGSMPSGLLALPTLSLRFAYPRLAATMVGLSHFAVDTLFQGMCRVLPGHVATWNGGSVTQRAFWRPPQDELRLSDDAYVEAYRHHLDQAVAARLRHRSGSIGAHLSAGYDSSAVAATAARLTEVESLTAFTCAPRSGFDGPVPPGRLADESGIAALAARRNGIEHVIVRPGREPSPTSGATPDSIRTPA